MIKANPTRWAKFIFHIYVMRLMKRQFHAFHLFGDLPQPDPDLPLLLIPNHSTWWDGFLVPVGLAEGKNIIDNCQLKIVN
jgi:1-acyl-sn-glycerol-3-phosphate acyltransferase